MWMRCHSLTKHVLPARNAWIGSLSSDRHQSRLTSVIRPPPKYDSTVFARVEDDEDRDIRLMHRISLAAFLICVGVVINDKLKQNQRWIDWSGRLKQYNTRWTNNDDLLVTFDARPSAVPDSTAAPTVSK
jgi:hypothetical protein